MELKNKHEIAIEKLISKSSDQFGEGLIVSKEKWDATNAVMDGKIPKWFIELFTKYPLSHAIMEIQDKENEDMEYVLEFVSPQWMESESIEAYPGCALLEHGYICIAADPTGGGDPYFINTLEGDNPAVYQIYHDVSDVGKEILAHGRQKVADSFSELFELGQLME